MHFHNDQAKLQINWDFQSYEKPNECNYSDLREIFPFEDSKMD